MKKFSKLLPDTQKPFINREESLCGFGGQLKRIIECASPNMAAQATVKSAW